MVELKTYEQTIHRIGRIRMSAAMLIIPAVPVAISLRLDTWPGFSSR